MDFEDVIQNVQEVTGYIGSAILNKGGEIVYIDEQEDIDIAFACSLFNDTFRVLSEASLDVGFSPILRLETETNEGNIFLIYSSGQHTLFTIFNTKGNISLAKMLIKKSLAKG
jgi:predicted regulator of Ras-like GTPase activity (Roadblock/LC7/MglB family)